MNRGGFSCSALVLAMAFGCKSAQGAPCPPCDSTAGYAHAPADESGTPQYYALPGLDHGLLQSPVNILSDETESGQHSIEYHGGIETGPKQIQRINLLEGNNARHVQALYSREIDEYSRFSTADRPGSARLLR